jgi:hypothetical protein
VSRQPDKRPPAYLGGEPYIFVSYARKNAALVYPHLAALRAEGFRLWYDREGIPPGEEWWEIIGGALVKASSFLLFLSPAAAASPNVRRELNLALKYRLPITYVYLAETALSPGLELQLGPIQSLCAYDYPDPAAFYQKLFWALPDKTCAGRRPQE